MGAGGRAGLTIVGQVAGSYFGPIGSMVGGMLGAALGNALWPEQIEGPKLGDFQLMSSTYGAAIPLLWGAMRVGGNVFWCSPIREVEVEEQQGKGGGAELKYKKRYADIAVGFCRGEATGIRKLWINQKLQFDLSDGADITSIFSSYGLGGEGVRFYPGSQTQLPDPTIEAVKGVGSTPAYRGLCYAVFTDIELGTTFPNITAEVVRGATTLGPRKMLQADWQASTRIHAVSGEITAVLVGGPEGATQTTGVVSTLEGDDLRIMPTSIIGGAEPAETTGGSGHYDTLLLPSRGVYAYISSDFGSRASQVIGSYSEGDGMVAPFFESVLSDGGAWIRTVVPLADSSGVLVLLNDTDDSTAQRWIIFDWAPEDEVGAFVEYARGTCDAAMAPPHPAAGPMGSRYGSITIFQGGMMESDRRHLWTAGAHLGIHVYEIGADGVMRTLALLDYDDDTLHTGQVSVFADNACCWVRFDDQLFGFTRAANLAADVTLDEVVEEICVLAGRSSGEIDATDLAEIVVSGYLFDTTGTARAAIEPLMVGYGFDGVESDDAIKFVLRHATPVVAIAQDDLGAGQGAAQEALVETVRTQESELPMLVEVSYVAPHADYQVGTQRVTRGTTESIERMRVQLKIAMSDEKGIECAYRIMYEGWTARNQRSFATTVKYAAYEPTDVLDLEVA